jgi:adenosylhomocysteine nucleosidase
LGDERAALDVRHRWCRVKYIAFVCAMPMEIKPLRRNLSLTRADIGSLEAYVGTLGERPVVAFVTGIGTVPATEGLERVLEAMEIERVLVVGLTGAVDEGATIGEVVRPEVVVNGVTGLEYRPIQLGGGVPRGTMWTSDELITDLDAIARLRSIGVIALDMETAAIAESCERHHIPWSVFRAFSDRSTDLSLGDDVLGLINNDGTINLSKLARFFVRHLNRVPALLRLAKDARLAAENAAATAIKVVAKPTSQDE